MELGLPFPYNIAADYDACISIFPQALTIDFHKQPDASIIESLDKMLELNGGFKPYTFFSGIDGSVLPQSDRLKFSFDVPPVYNVQTVADKIKAWLETDHGMQVGMQDVRNEDEKFKITVSR